MFFPLERRKSFYENEKFFELLDGHDFMLGHGFVTKISIALLIYRYDPKLSKKFIKQERRDFAP